jgi:hypothetical protein
LGTYIYKKYFRGTPIIKLESIFINAKTISIQWRVSECDVKLAQSGPTKFRQYYPKLDEHYLQAGHCPHDEVPDQVNRLIKDWIVQNFPLA